MKDLADKIMMDEAFQAALQRYAHGNGSSAAVANAAARVTAAPLEGVSDEQIIERCNAAGVRWIEPQAESGGWGDIPAIEGFPGGFDMCSMEEMRRLLAAPASPQPLAPPPGYAVVPVHWRALLSDEQRPQQPATRLHVVGFGDKRAAESWVAEQLEFKGWKYTLEDLYAAPQPPASVQPLAVGVCQCGMCCNCCPTSKSNVVAASPPPTGRVVPLTPEQRQKIFQQVRADVATLEAEHRYTFAGWFPIAVRLIEAAHGIKEGS